MGWGAKRKSKQAPLATATTAVAAARTLPLATATMCSHPGIPSLAGGPPRGGPAPARVASQREQREGNWASSSAQPTRRIAAASIAGGS